MHMINIQTPKVKLTDSVKHFYNQKLSDVSDY